MVEQRKQRGWRGSYVGPRVNCERVPCLPAAAVAWVLNDPRQVPYLMLWKNEDSDKLVEAVRVTRCNEAVARELDCADVLDVKRTDGSQSWIWTIERPLPRHRGKARLFICPRCQHPRRALYAWKLNPSKPHAVFHIYLAVPIMRPLAVCLRGRRVGVSPSN